MSRRLNRGERQERTRTGLVDAARRVFLRRGFHGASLDEIAEEVGYTKGAVYSNFHGKDDIFLAVLDAHIEQRVREYIAIVLDRDGFEESVRAAGRHIAQRTKDEPEWSPLLIEFWMHAARREQLRREVVARHERILDAVAGILAQLAARHHVEYLIPAQEVARGSFALVHGMALERLLDPTTASAELFEEMFLGYVRGLTRGRGEPRTPRRERNP